MQAREILRQIDCALPRRNGRDYLFSGKLPTLSPLPVRTRKDTVRHEKKITYPEQLRNMWQSVSAESDDMRRVWDHRQHQWRIPRADGTTFVIQLTDAASAHTEVTFVAEEDGNTYSAMIMVWFGIERDTTADDECTELLIEQDDTEPSGIALFSNQQLIENYPELEPAIQQAIAEAMSIAVGFLQDQLNLEDSDEKPVGGQFDLAIGIGSRTPLELKLGRQAPGPQSGVLGHIVVIHHPENETGPDSLEKVSASTKEALKVMDPWVEILSSMFREPLRKISLQALAEEPSLRGVNIKLVDTWDGFEIIFEDGVSVTTAYTATSALYRSLSRIQKGAIDYYQAFISCSDETGAVDARGAFVTSLQTQGTTPEEAESFIQFIESLEPTYSIVQEVRTILSPEEENPRVTQTRKSIDRFNSPLRGQYTTVIQKKIEAKIVLLEDERSYPNITSEELEKIASRIATLRKRLLTAHLISQRLRDPRLPGNTIENMLPQSRLTAVNVIRDFEIDETDNVVVKTMHFALSFSGRGAFEVVTGGVINRPRPI